MKFLLIVFLSILSSSAFAGDLYFICATEDQSEEVFLINKYIDPNGPMINRSLNDPISGKLINLTFDPLSRLLKVVPGFDRELHIVAVLEINYSIKISDGIICKIAD